jgi:hypothetical protein
MVEKFKKDGKVAVLYSPGFGAGWSTWAYGKDVERMIFDPELVQAVLDGDPVKTLTVTKRNFPNEYDGGVEDLAVYWLDEGERFEITEYDGSEQVRIFGKADGYVA